MRVDQLIQIKQALTASGLKKDCKYRPTRHEYINKYVEMIYFNDKIHFWGRFPTNF